MNTASGFLLYLIGGFALVVATIKIPGLQYYTGAFVIFLFMGGLFFAWLNAIRQGNKIPDAPREQEKENPPEQQSHS